jgi:spermidine synthase
MTAIAAARLSAVTPTEGVRPINVRRNFYGVLTVKQYTKDTDDVARLLDNGHILHGLQFTHSIERRLPTAYFGWNSGVGRVMQFYQAKNAAELRVGIIGLGTGTMAAYARPQDRFVFYEINPEVLTVSRQYFTFLADAERRMAKNGRRPEVVMGDARLSLERDLAAPAGPTQFDVIVLDAFTGDAIPTHFLTREAADIYRRHLASGGTVAIHITNRYLDLTPVAQGLADHLKLAFVEIETPRVPDHGEEAADWAILTSNAGLRSTLEQAAATSATANESTMSPPDSKSATTADYLGPQVPFKVKSRRPPLLWTDDFSDLFSVLR